jgi:hypothetical protein
LQNSKTPFSRSVNPTGITDYRKYLFSPIARLSRLTELENPVFLFCHPIGIPDYRKNLFFSNGSPLRAPRGKKHF